MPQYPVPNYQAFLQRIAELTNNNPDPQIETVDTKFGMLPGNKLPLFGGNNHDVNQELIGAYLNNIFDEGQQLRIPDPGRFAQPGDIELPKEAMQKEAVGRALKGGK
jgi:hypothetical protein